MRVFAQIQEGSETGSCRINGNIYNFVCYLKEGKSTNLTAQAAAGFRFVTWQKISGENAFSGELTDPTITAKYTAGVQSAQINAIFEYGIYQLSLDPTGGVMDESGVRIVTNRHDRTCSPLPEPTRIGYEFINWFNEDESLEVAVDTNHIWFVSNTTFKAHWTANKYLTTFDSNGGKHGQVRIEQTFGEKYELPSDEWSRDGYTFDGWKTAADETITDTSIVAIPSNHVIYAQWEAKTYSIKLWPSNGDDFKTYTVVHGQPYGEIPPPAKVPDGMVFDGWSFEPSGSSRIRPETIVENGNDLCARWIARKYQVTLDVDGGACDTPSVEIAYNEEFGNRLPDATRTGYRFEGWYTAKDQSGTKIEPTTTYTWTSNIVLFAHWRARTYALRFKANGGEPEPVSTNVTYDATYEGLLPVVSKTGYDFAGWYTAAGEKIELSTKVTTTSDQTLDARWDAKMYGITTKVTNAELFVTDHGVYDEPLAISWRPLAKPGYSAESVEVKICGDEASSGEVLKTFTSGTNATFTMSAARAYYPEIVIFAEYALIPNRYEIVFDANGGSGSMDTLRVNYDQEVPLPACAFTPKQLTDSFVGWSTNRLATEDEILSPGAMVSKLVETGSVTFYAIWKDARNELTKAAHGVGVTLVGGDPNQSKLGSFVAVTNAVGETCVASPVNQWTAVRILPLDNKKGKIVFSWRNIAEAKRIYVVYIDGGTSIESRFIEDLDCVDEGDGWRRVELSLSENTSGHEILIHALPDSEADGTLELDRVEWWSKIIPQPEDARDISGLTIGNGELSLSFDNADERFVYQLHGSKELMAPLGDWPVVFTTNGTGHIDIELPVKAGETQMFYYLQTISR